MAKKKKSSAPAAASTATTLPPAYTALYKGHRIEYIIEKSRFIATAAPCRTEEEVQAFFARITKEFWDATHNCTAYALGPSQEQQRSSDNGEPSGTAGKPMLEVLKKTGITDTAIVVTRYFGGIKLGAGGLIRAYSHSAAEVLRQAPKALYAPRIPVVITIDYTLFGAVERFLKEDDYRYEVGFGDTVTLTVWANPDSLTALQTRLTDICSGRLSWDAQEPVTVCLPLTT